MRATKAHVETLVDGLDHPEGVCWDPASRCLYAGGEEGQLYRVDLERREWEEIARAPAQVLGLAGDGRGRVVLCCAQAGVHVWDGERLHALMGDLTFANSPAFAPDGTLFVSDSGSWSENGGSIRAIAPDGTTRTVSEDCPCFTNGLAVSPDG